MRGKMKYRAAWRKYDDQLAQQPGERHHPPKQPRSEMERGLVYASRAGVIPAQAVGPIVDDAERFRTWLSRRKPARGPAPDVVEAVRLFAAIEVVRKVRKRLGLDEDDLFASEVGQAWELVHAGS